jgi:hypothetical protein
LLEPYPPALYALVIFGTESHVYVQAVLDFNPALYASSVAGTTCHHAQLLAKMGGLTNFLPGLASNHDSPNFCLPSSWDYRYEPLQSTFPCILLNWYIT